MSGGHTARVRQVREAFDVDALAVICTSQEDYFSKYGTEYFRDAGKGKHAFYCKDDVSDVLAIAHLDSVQKPGDFGIAKYVSGKEHVLSPTLDDRLGAYVICELLPKLGIKTDILLTTDEEGGNSTAKFFETTKTYKWMFEFDRAGDDVVMYQYDTPELRKKLEAAGFKCGNGSASDISKLGDLGCSGMNFGVGYEDYHYSRAWADLNVMFEQVARFWKFYKTHHSEHLVYDKTARQTSAIVHTYTPGPSGGGSWQPSHSTWPPYGDQETEWSFRKNGQFFNKLDWDSDKRLYLPNERLYKAYPEAKEPPRSVLIERNMNWDPATQKRVLAYGRYSEEEIMGMAHQILDQCKGIVDAEIIVQEVADSEGKSPQGASSNGISAGHTSGGSADDPCMCGHSRYIHKRTVWKKGHIPQSHDGCDFYKCSCWTFESADNVFGHRSDIPARSFDS